MLMGEEHRPMKSISAIRFQDTVPLLRANPGTARPEYLELRSSRKE